MLFGERPSQRPFSTKARSFGSSAIFIHWNFAYFFRTYALCFAIFESYFPSAFLLRAISSEMDETARPSSFAISRNEYFFFFKIAISSRSASESFDAPFFFFAILSFFHTYIIHDYDASVRIDLGMWELLTK